MLEEVKDYLKITWDDEDAPLTSMIGLAKANLNDLTGVELDFESDGLARTLFFEYCRYYYNNALEYFEENFQKELNRLMFQEAIKDAKQKK